MYRGLIPLLIALTICLPVVVASTAARPPGPSALQFAPYPDIHARRHGNLRLTSVLVTNGAPYPGTEFTVLRDQPEAFGKTRAVVVAMAGPREYAEFDLAPGQYRVQARNGAVRVEQPLSIPPGGVLNLQAVLDAGELHLSALMAADGDPAESAWFRVLRAETDSYGHPEMVQVAGNGYGQTASFLLPAGDYVAEASFGDARVQTQVRIDAGGVHTRQLALNAGHVTLHASLDAGGEPLDAVDFAIVREPDESGAAPFTITQTGADGPLTFVLPAGHYRARAQRDLAVSERAFDLQGGGSAVIELPLQAGELVVHATLGGVGDPLLDSWFALRPVGVPEGQLAPNAIDSPRGPDNHARFVVPAGRYQVLAANGESRGAQTVGVTAGSSQSLGIDLDAGRVSLRLADDATAPAYPYSWFSVYRVEHDDDGREWRRRVYNAGYFADTDIVLPSGDYVAFARSDGRRGDLAFSVAPGSNQAMTIPTGD